MRMERPEKSKLSDLNWSEERERKREGGGDAGKHSTKEVRGHNESVEGNRNEGMEVTGGGTQMNTRVVTVSWLDQRGALHQQDGGEFENSGWGKLMAERKRAVEKRIFDEKGDNKNKVPLKKMKGRTDQEHISQKGKEGEDQPLPASVPASLNLARPGGILDIAEIVKHIALHLPTLSDLKAFRLVSKLCRDETMSIWRRKAVLVLRNSPMMVLLRAYVHNTDVEEDLPKLHKNPFVNFRFPESAWWSYPINDREEGVQRKKNLWKMVLGPRAKFLDLGQSKLCAVPNERGNRTSFYSGAQWILSSVPLLEELQCNPVCDENGAGAATMNPDWNYTAPNMTSLSVPYAEPSFDKRFVFDNPLELEGFVRMLPHLKNVRAFGDTLAERILKILTRWDNNPDHGSAFGQLERFHGLKTEQCWRHNFTDSLIEYLAKYKNVRELQTPLSADAMLHKNTEGYLILRHVGASIQKLTLDIDAKFIGNPSNSKILIVSNLPEFPNLTELTLELEYSCDNQHKQEGLGFPFQAFVKMPQLRKFIFQSKPFDAVLPPAPIIRLDIRESSPGFTLSSLTHFRYSGSMQRLALKELAAIGPNIRYLQMALLKDNVPVLISHFKKLQNLRLMYGSQLWEKDVQELTSSISHLQISKAQR